jgi:metal-responsive CopG/Arc/MetJ family transcriptional regulator
MKSTNVIRKKLGRPTIGKKAAKLFAIRLPDEVAKNVKAFAKANDIKSQSEAIRRLVEHGLKHWGG